MEPKYWPGDGFPGAIGGTRNYNGGQMYVRSYSSGTRTIAPIQLLSEIWNRTISYFAGMDR